MSMIADKVAKVQMLMTQRERNLLPKLRAQENVEDPIVYVKFFHPYGSGTWLATEFDGHDEFFGAVKLHGDWELGYFSLTELTELRANIGGREHQDIQAIERDTSFRPMPLSKAKHA
jgi:hypothetical protein